MSVVMPSSVARHLGEAAQVTNTVAHTFALAIRFLPAHLRDDIQLLYLVCRTLDDLADTRQPQAGSHIARVQSWAAGYTEPKGREERILAYLCEGYPAIPRDAIVDFCSGLLGDLEGVHIRTESDLDLYAYRVAGTVGRLMAGILGLRDPEGDAAARALGIAMQRTNILRDIDEDLAMGRVYIPQATLEMAGIGDLRRHDRRTLLRIEIALADRWYEQGLTGTQYLVSGGWQVRAAGRMYQEILRQIERDGFGRVRPRRVSVPAPRKALLMAGSVLRP